MSSAGLITGETRITSTAPAAIKAVGTPRPDLTAKFWRGSLVLLAALALPAAIFVLWHEATARQWISLQVLPPPAWVFNTFIDLLRTGEILANIQISFTRIAWGLMIGASLGFLFGLLIGFSRQADSYLGTTFRAVATVPALGWLPILILLLGIDESLKIVILSKACFVPMAISISQGVRSIPSRLREVADVLTLSRRTRFFKLTLPAIMPFFFTGLRFSTAQAFTSLIVVEMLAGTDGIGYMMVWGRTLFQLDIVMAGIIVVGMAGFSLDLLLRRIEARFPVSEDRHG